MWVKTGGGSTASLEDFEGMAKDPSALAAYTVHFAYDSAAVRKSEKSNIQAVVSALNADSRAKLLIEGNCDERGTEDTTGRSANAARAGVAQALAKAGVDSMRIRTISYGKDKRWIPPTTKRPGRKNRRGTSFCSIPRADPDSGRKHLRYSGAAFAAPFLLVRPAGALAGWSGFAHAEILSEAAPNKSGSGRQWPWRILMV